MTPDDYRQLPIWVQAAIDNAGLGRGSGGVSQIMRVEFDEDPPAVAVALRPKIDRVAVTIVREGG